MLGPDLAGNAKRLMGFEPTTFCMASMAVAPLERVSARLSTQELSKMK
jgi:hypothetical protein